MKFFSVFTLEIKRVFPLFFLIAVALLVSLSVAQLQTSSFNVIGIVEFSSPYVEVAGYGFNFHGQGVPLVVNVSIAGMHKSIVSKNGTFSVLIVTLSSKGSLLTVNISSGNQNYLIHIYLLNNFTTFAKVSEAYSEVNYNNISMVYVKGVTIVAAAPSVRYINVNGQKMPVTSNILYIKSDNVKLPYTNINNLRDSLIIGKNIYYILAIVGVNMALVSIIAYFDLSVFSRQQMNLIFRIAGVSKVYLSKLLSMVILTLLISVPSLAVFEYIKGIFLSSTIPYIYVILMYLLAVYGVSPLMGSKELIYSSSIIAIYLLNLVFYNIEILSVVALILPLIGFIKLWRRYG